MRIAIGQLWQETNTFNPLPTTRTDFETFAIVAGQELVERMAQMNELGGFIQSLRLWPEKPTIVGMVRLPAWPSGPATAETFTWLREQLLEALRTALPVDGVLLALHGSLVSENVFDVEGAILQAYRQLLGPEIPLVATLDLHANITDRMVRSADALVLYHTAPHIDVFETGQRVRKCSIVFSPDLDRLPHFKNCLWLFRPREHTPRIREASVTRSANSCKSGNAIREFSRPGWRPCSPGSTSRSLAHRSLW